MSTPTPPDTLPKLTYELFTLLTPIADGVNYNRGDKIVQLGAQIVPLYSARINVLEEATRFDWEWCSLTWPLLTLSCRMMERRRTREEDSVLDNLNNLLVQLVNKVCSKTRQPSAPPGMQLNNYHWINFWTFYHETVSVLHSLYSQLDSPRGDLEDALSSSQEIRYLNSYLRAYKEVCYFHRAKLMPTLRRSQIQRMTNMGPMSPLMIEAAKGYYCNMQYALGLVAARLQGFRWEALRTKFPFSNPDPVKPLLDMVFTSLEQMSCDGMLGTKPSTNAILVTNNLFSFNCNVLVPGMFVRHFDVQIVGEETAVSIQNEMQQVQKGLTSTKFTSSFNSAALIAMKPTSGVKRNNATAYAEGGNTAHKKSDVNSKESVCITPVWNDEKGVWAAHYPHLLCTTRQKDTMLQDNRIGQIGKRPMFYFYIRGSYFSATGGLSYIRTLSLPFTIATRRNQDCQVQRMMSSYTATCFWLYGLHSLDGLILHWCDSGIEWTRFVQLYRAYFSVNADVVRPLGHDDIRLLEEKLDCEECREHTTQVRERLVTFKNVLCPHLRYDTDQQQMRFSIWRGLLEVLQIFQDARTHVNTLWNDYVLMGFNDINVINDHLMAHQSVMCLRISYVSGGSICVSMRPPTGVVVHLEPIDLKKLQAKNAVEYIADIAESAKIEFVITAQLEKIPVSELITKYKIGADRVPARHITTNISHGGPIEKTTRISFTPLRIAVVCPNVAPIEEHETVEASGTTESTAVAYDANIQEDQQSTMQPYTNDIHMDDNRQSGYSSGVLMANGQPSLYSNGLQTMPTMDFTTQLLEFMRINGKTAQDVLQSLGYVDHSYQEQQYSQQAEQRLETHDLPPMHQYLHIDWNADQIDYTIDQFQ